MSFLRKIVGVCLPLQVTRLVSILVSSLSSNNFYAPVLTFPVCQENLSLRVERCVDIFGNIMAPSDEWLDGPSPLKKLMFTSHHETIGTEHVQRYFRFELAVCLRETYEWLKQALLLESKGMPQRAFTLTFAALPRTHRALVSLIRP